MTDEEMHNDLAVEQTLPPCHRTNSTAGDTADETSNETSNETKETPNEISMSGDTCCLMCLAMVPVLEISQATTCPQAPSYVGAASTLLSASIDPLFRPPIS